ncbi:MAG: hypothetical protein H8E98_05125 [Bacteroidetes bacterium]|nr:hypothetical protein [Bacteroidota bacterium]
MRTVIVVVLAVLFSCAIAYSQETSNVTSKQSKNKNLNHYIKVSPFSLLEIEPSLMLGYSYPIRKGESQLQHEIAYVFVNDILFVNYDNPIDFNGFRLRTNYRSYFESNSRKVDSLRNSNNRFYFGLDAMYKYCNYTEYGVSIWRMNQFTQETDISTEKHVGAAHFTVGVETNFIKGSNSIIDLYMGIGVRYKYFNTKFNGVTDSNLETEFGRSNRLWYDDFSVPMMVSVMAGMKIGFSL